MEFWNPILQEQLSLHSWLREAEDLNIRKSWLLFAALGLIIGIAYTMTSWFPGTPQSKPFQSGMEAGPGKRYTLGDTTGRTILQTGFPVAVGDEFIDEDNTRYRISSLDGWNGTMERVIEKKPARKGLTAIIEGAQPVQAEAEPPPRVAIYCTHSDESYKPSQGKTSERGGGAIFRVGYALASSLVDDGITVDQSFAAHDPHDINAYSRSRRTLMQLLKDGPTAAFDVHRDSAPAEAYLTYITGVESAKVMIVIGRQNPNMNANMAFAERLRNVLMKCTRPDPRIFIGQGCCNRTFPGPCCSKSALRVTRQYARRPLPVTSSAPINT